jgi:hypothetical protein
MMISRPFSIYKVRGGNSHILKLSIKQKMYNAKRWKQFTIRYLVF